MTLKGSVVGLGCHLCEIEHFVFGRYSQHCGALQCQAFTLPNSVSCHRLSWMSPKDLVLSKISSKLVLAPHFIYELLNTYKLSKQKRKGTEQAEVKRKQIAYFIRYQILINSKGQQECIKELKQIGRKIQRIGWISSQGSVGNKISYYKNHRCAATPDLLAHLSASKVQSITTPWHLCENLLSIVHRYGVARQKPIGFIWSSICLGLSRLMCCTPYSPKLAPNRHQLQILLLNC